MGRDGRAQTAQEIQLREHQAHYLPWPVCGPGFPAGPLCLSLPHPVTLARCECLWTRHGLALVCLEARIVLAVFNMAASLVKDVQRQT